MLDTRIKNYLNQGGEVAAEIELSSATMRCFVKIRAIAKPGISREEYRYLNSKYSMWEYWNYEFRRMVLRSGWEENEWEYDCYLILDERQQTATQSDFCKVLQQWVPDPTALRHITELECP
jgi:hypothetical protein